MNIKFDFAVHWLFAIVFALLTFSGIAMIGARFGWVLHYDITLADYIHRIAAVFFLALAPVFMIYEIYETISGGRYMRPWGLFKPGGFGLFTLIVSLGLILSGMVLWKGHETNKAALAFSMFVHEKLTYIALGGVIWHIYQKAHALVWPKAGRVSGGSLMTEPGFKLFVWVLTTSFFFCTSAVIVSIAGPEPGAAKVGLFMQGMHQAMKGSLMGIAAMDTALSPVMKISGLLLVETLVLALAAAAILFQRERNDE